MNFFKSLVSILVISFLFPSYALAGNIDFIPLNEGSWWKYKVSYAYSEYDAEKDKEVVYKGTIQVKIEILKVAKYKDVTVALFSDIPGGLFWGKATLFVAGNKDYYWT